jgi:molybdopterin-synthase adenylyltransferase
MKERFDRQIRLFGAEGQIKLAEHVLAFVGAGGLGSIALQQAAYLGVDRIIVIEHERADATNLNRYVSLQHADIYQNHQVRDEEPLKTELAERLIKKINPRCIVECFPYNVRDSRSLAKLREADSVIGCVDNDAARLILTDVTRALNIPYLDMASDIEAADKVRFGGRIFFTSSRRGCLYCAREIDREEAAGGILDPSVTQDRNAIYGVDKTLLNEKGPSIITLNTLVAGIGMMEWLASVTGIREAKQLLYYRGLQGTVTINNTPDLDHFCYYCDELRGHPENSVYLNAVRRIPLGTLEEVAKPVDSGLL